MTLIQKIIFFFKPNQEIRTLRTKFSYYLESHNVVFTPTEFNMFCSEMVLTYHSSTPENVKIMCEKHFGDKTKGLSVDDYKRICSIFLSYDKPNT